MFSLEYFIKPSYRKIFLVELAPAHLVKTLLELAEGAPAPSPWTSPASEESVHGGAVC